MNYLDPSKFKKCPKCGADISSGLFKEKFRYSLFGWYMWSQGSTVIPKKIVFTCSNCNILIDKVSDRNLIEYYINNKQY